MTKISYFGQNLAQNPGLSVRMVNLSWELAGIGKWFNSVGHYGGDFRGGVKNGREALKKLVAFLC